MNLASHDRSDDAHQLPDRWITDTPTTARFPHVTRANADEVAPTPISPLGWCIGWANGAQLGVADGYVRFGVIAAEELAWPRPETFGNWGGYFYNQLSLSRLVGVRMPGASAQAIDRAYFGENPDVPPYVADPRDENEEQSAKLAGVIATVMASTSYAPFEEYLTFSHGLKDNRPDLTEMSDRELIDYALTFGPHLRYTWDVYAYVVLGASIGPGAVQAVCESIGRAEDVSRLFGAVGSVVSASSANALWELSRLVKASPALSRLFDGGGSDLLTRIRAASEDEAHAFADSFDDLLRQYGHRGPNEWDLASPTWESHPDIPLHMIDQLRRQDDSAAPSQRTGNTAAAREALVAELHELAAAQSPELAAALHDGLRSGIAYYRMREAGKDAAVRVMNEGRLPLRELGRRLCAGGDLSSPDHIFMLLDSELDDLLADPKPLAEQAGERARVFADLAELEPPYVVSYPQGAPPMSTWSRRGAGKSESGVAAGTVLQGIGVSTGVAVGTARVVNDLADADSLEPGDVLICTTTDPSWVPIFLVAGAVVCDVGALASHAAIVTRELGVPCAVSVRDATRLIPSGAQVSVDGSTGEVRVVSLPAG